MIELYRVSGCGYCRRVEHKLEELDLEYRTHDVPWPIGQRNVVEEVSGQRLVPVIVDESNGVSGMAESRHIVEYLEHTYGTA